MLDLVKRNKFKTLFLCLMIILCVIFVWKTYISSMSTDTSSSKFVSVDEKKAFLAKYIKMKSDIIDTEYHIVFHDNSRGLPAPSDYDMKIAVLVDKNNLNNWIDGYTEISQKEIDLKWCKELNLNPSKWNLSVQSKFYKSDSNSKIIYENGVILMHLVTH